MDHEIGPNLALERFGGELVAMGHFFYFFSQKKGKNGQIGPFFDQSATLDHFGALWTTLDHFGALWKKMNFYVMQDAVLR